MGLTKSLFLFIVIKGLTFVFAIPPWQGPDEPHHFEYVAILIKTSPVRLSVSRDTEVYEAIVKSMDSFRSLDFIESSLTRGSFWALHYPPLYYSLLALFSRLFNISSLMGQLYLSRIISSFFDLGIFVLVFLTARKIFLAGQPRSVAPTLGPHSGGHGVSPLHSLSQGVAPALGAAMFVSLKKVTSSR